MGMINDLNKKRADLAEHIVVRTLESMTYVLNNWSQAEWDAVAHEINHLPPSDDTKVVVINIVKKLVQTIKDHR